jgi:hypothetical protein
MQAQELQQRVQMQKAHLNNQLQNFGNMPPQQQMLVQQQRLQQQAMHQNRMMGQQGQQFQPPMMQQQVPIYPGQAQMGPGMVPGAGGQGLQQPHQTPHPQQQSQPVDPRADNSAALHDYQMQLMMLENQTKMSQQMEHQAMPQGQQMPGQLPQMDKGRNIAVDPLHPDPMSGSIDLFPSDLPSAAQWGSEELGFSSELNF